MFFPTLANSDLSDDEQLSMEDALKKYPGHPAVAAMSGDLACYDGVLNGARIIDTTLGLPHVSPDYPGQTSRLLC